MVNTHIHLPPNFSAFATIEDAVLQAKEENCTLLGVNNYYDFTVYETFANLCKAHGIAPTFGIEILCFDEDLAEQSIRINDPANPGKIYLCGKQIDWQNPTPRAQQMLAQMRQSDSQRIQTIADKLNETLNLNVDVQEIMNEVATCAGVPTTAVVLQERHLAQAFVNAITNFNQHFPNYQGKTNAEAQNHLRNELMKKGKPCYVKENYMTLAEGIELVKELNGIAAYPWLGDGVAGFTEFERNPENLSHQLSQREISWIETIPSRNDASILNEHASHFLDQGFTLSAGTEHNTPGWQTLKPMCRGSAEISLKLVVAFWRTS